MWAKSFVLSEPKAIGIFLPPGVVKKRPTEMVRDMRGMRGKSDENGA